MTSASTRSGLHAVVAASLLTLSLLATGASAEPKEKKDKPKARPAQQQQQEKRTPKNAQAKPEKANDESKKQRSGQPGKGAENGNPGTIKVAVIGDGTHPDTEPHPGCAARIDFYNFNPKTYGVEFTAIAPTAGGVVGGGSVTITAAPTGGDDVQHSEVFALDLSGLTPAAQGYHIKVRVTNPDKPGNGAKSKVFWLDCVPTAAPATSADEDEAAVLGVRRALAARLGDGDDTAVLGVRLERPAATTQPARATRPAGTLPFTGSERTIPFLVAAALLIAVGTGLVTVTRGQARATVS